MDTDAKLNKLIRLTTNDRNAIFDAEFDEEVLIPPQTEVALKSASIALTGAQEVISPEGDGGLVTIFHNAIQHDIQVNPGTYNVNNIDELFADMTRKLNGSIVLGQDTIETNLEYLVAVNQSARVEIQNIYAHYISPTGTGVYDYEFSGQQARFWKTVGGLATLESVATANDGIITRAATSGLTTTPDYRGTVFSDFSFSGGAGVWRSVIQRLRPPLGAGSISGFCIGFTVGRSVLLRGQVTDEDVVCAVRVQADSAGGVGNFEFKSSRAGTFQDTGVSPGTVATAAPNPNNVNPCLEWLSTRDAATNQHILKLMLHRNGVAAVELGRVDRVGDLASDKELIGFYAFYAGETFNDITAIEYIPSFFNSTVRQETMEHITGLNLTHSTAAPLKGSDLPGLMGDRGMRGTPCRYRMIIPNPILKERIMGFDPSLYRDNNGNPPALNTLYDVTSVDLLFPSGSFEGAHPIREILPYINLVGAAEGIISPETSFAIFGSTNYLVELLNLPLNTYDSFPSKRGRANILAIIPQNEHESGNVDNVLMYEPNEMTYISLTNKSELSLRNIRARIIFPDYTPIETVGMTTLVFHIRPGK